MQVWADRDERLILYEHRQQALSEMRDASAPDPERLVDLRCASLRRNLGG